MPEIIIIIIIIIQINMCAVCSFPLIFATWEDQVNDVCKGKHHYHYLLFMQQ